LCEHHIGETLRLASQIDPLAEPNAIICVRTVHTVAPIPEKLGCQYSTSFPDFPENTKWLTSAPVAENYRRPITDICRCSAVPGRKFAG